MGPSSGAKQKAKQDEKDSLRTQPFPLKLEPEEKRAFRNALAALQDSGVAFVVGGAFAKYFYAGFWRYTKDLDIFLRPADLKAALDALSAVKFGTLIHEAHWLAKASQGEAQVDLIFGTAHGRWQLDERFFEGGISTDIFGSAVRLLAVEEIIAMSAYVATRQRFDGGDIAHLIRAAQGKLDWLRILDRLGPDWPLLLWHLILFDFVYPGHSNYLPHPLMVEQFKKLEQRWQASMENEQDFRGTLLDRLSFAVDVKDWGYTDLRIEKPLVDQDGNLLRP